jgi:hypothetical protein
MNRIAITILFFISTAAIGFGAIGDDEKQIEARYGKPGKDLGNHGNVHEVGYMAGGFMILVDFVDGISRREGFVNPNTAPLTEQDIKAILTMSAPEGLTWDPGDVKQEGRSWNRSDQKAIAILPTESKFLFVQDVNFTQPR